MKLKSLLREPLLHFLVAGAALFLWYQWSGGGTGPASTRIVLTAGQVDHLAAGFAKTWLRPATEGELKSLCDDWVREEIAVREAMAMGLDRDDTVIRRRLRQKLEFLVEDFVASAPPTDVELQAFLDAHSEMFRLEPQVELRQVFVSREHRSPTAGATANALLARLSAAGSNARIDQLGDPSMLPQELALAPVGEIERQFGKELVEHLAPLATGVWSGPVESTYGLHLVLVRRRVDGSLPPLAQVRSAVERELLADRRTRQLAEIYDKLLAKYTVVIERRGAGAPEGAPGKRGS